MLQKSPGLLGYQSEQLSGLIIQTMTLIHILSLPLVFVLYLTFSILKLHPPRSWLETNIDSWNLLPSRSPLAEKLPKGELWSYCTYLGMMTVYAIAATITVGGFIFFVITGALEQGSTGIARAWIIISGFAIFMWLINRSGDSLSYWFGFFAGIAIFGAAIYLALSVLS